MCFRFKRKIGVQGDELQTKTKKKKRKIFNCVVAHMSPLDHRVIHDK